MVTRSPLVSVVIGFVALIGLLSSAPAAQIVVGNYLINAEATLTPAAPKYSAQLNLSAQTRLVVQIAPQYGVDFGIIPAADLKKWRSGQVPRYLFRLTGRTDTRYITLNAGSYYVVARNMGAGIASNGISTKVRRFTGKASDDGQMRTFVLGQKNNVVVPPDSWDGFVFEMPTSGKVWFDGTYSRGAERAVTWKIVTASDFQKFVSGLQYKAQLSGSNPKALGFQLTIKPGRYYFLLFNQGGSYSAVAAARELYR